MNKFSISLKMFTFQIKTVELTGGFRGFFRVGGLLGGGDFIEIINILIA